MAAKSSIFVAVGGALCTLALSSSRREGDRLNALFSWADKLEIPSKINIGENKKMKGDYGSFLAQDVKAGEELIRLPPHIVLCSHHTRETYGDLHSLFPNLMSEHQIAPTALALALLTEKHRGDTRLATQQRCASPCAADHTGKDSFWGPWIDFLPDTVPLHLNSMSLTKASLLLKGMMLEPVCQPAGATAGTELQRLQGLKTGLQGIMFATAALTGLVH